MNSEYTNINNTNDYEIKNEQLILQNQKNNRLQKARAHLEKLKQINKTLTSFHHQPLSPTFQNKFNIQFSPIFSHKTKDNQACRDINEILRRAKIFHMRDRQIEHNNKMEAIYRKKEERLDKMMELERLKELKYNEDKKKFKKEQIRAHPQRPARLPGDPGPQGAGAPVRGPGALDPGAVRRGRGAAGVPLRLPLRILVS